MKFKYILFVFLVFLGVKNGFGQDVQLSQFYAAQTLLNPAFAGAVHTHRAMFHQRVQWPGLDAKYMTSLFSYDNFSTKYRSGYGIYALRDNLGQNITSTELHFQYSYELPLSKTFSLRSGLQAGFVARNLEYSDLRLPHQFDDKGFISGSSFADLGISRKLYPDISSGFVFYSDNFWLSASGSHLNVPNQSVIGNVARLPIKYVLATGYKINLKKGSSNSLSPQDELSITPVFNYKFQGKSDQADIGAYVIYNQLMLGTWYKGIPFKQYENFQNNESIVFIAGWMYQNWIFSYSYDLTTSKLKVAKTRGAHELNITYIHYHKGHRKPLKRLPCPNFYQNKLF